MAVIVVLVAACTSGQGGGRPAGESPDEVGHQWRHALVGNDSIRAPVVDEPLAQFWAPAAQGWTTTRRSWVISRVA
jgi:hypothetical protein